MTPKTLLGGLTLLSLKGEVSLPAPDSSKEFLKNLLILQMAPEVSSA